MLQSTRERFETKGPKRILCLDGGGLRGSLTLGILKELESFLRDRYGNDPRFRLGHYFDLIAGTSTGAIIAAMLAQGQSVEAIYYYYERLGEEVFRTTLLGKVTAGMVRSRYDRDALERYLQEAVGSEARLGGDSLITGLLIVAKHIDNHSVWPLGNNPNGQWFEASGGAFANKDYRIWKLLRASAAAPTYFDPETVEIRPGELSDFIDGGMSPFNDPSLQALMYATMKGYRVGWSTGAENLLLVSVGTGSFKPTEKEDDENASTDVPQGLERRRSRLMEPGSTVKRAFFSLMYDNQKYTKALMQWLSDSPTATNLDGEFGDLKGEVLGGRELLSYVRLDVELKPKSMRDVLSELSDVVRGREVDFDSLKRMDEPDNVDLMWRIGREVGASRIRKDFFPPGFDLQRAPPNVLRLGVTGHRLNVLRPHHLEPLRARVDETLARIASAVNAASPPRDEEAPPVCLVTAIAEGADRIAAWSALDQRCALECWLPFDRNEYEQDFLTMESRREFRQLLKLADVVEELPGSRDAEQDAYADVGSAVRKQSHLLLAIWDGEEARGRGGTAEVVREALDERIPVIWIHSEPSKGVRLLWPEQDGEPASAWSDQTGLDMDVLKNALSSL